MTVWINLIYQLAKRLVQSAALWRWIESRVIAASRAEHLCGGQKRTWVAQQIEQIPAAYRPALTALGAWALNLAIEAMVAKLKVSKAA